MFYYDDLYRQGSTYYRWCLGHRSGQALGLSFGKHGARIAFSDINETNIATTKALYKEAGIVYTSFVSDVSSEVETEQLIANVINAYGRLDVLIANAGIGKRLSIEEMDLDIFRNIMKVNFFGAVYVTKYALPHLLQTKGSVVAISSVVGCCSMPKYSPYAASKSAMQSYFEVLRMETHKRLHTLIVCPGITNTSMMKRSLANIGMSSTIKMMKPDTAAEAIYRAYRRKQRKLILTWKGRLTVWFSRMFPQMTARIITAVFARIEKRNMS